MLLGVKVHRRNLESTSGDVWTNQLFIAENAKQESVCPSKMCLDEAVDVARASGIQRGAEKHPSNHSDLCLVSIVDIQYSTERLDLLDGAIEPIIRESISGARRHLSLESFSFSNRWKPAEPEITKTKQSGRNGHDAPCSR